jgi:hypothetical protein
VRAASGLVLPRGNVRRDFIERREAPPCAEQTDHGIVSVGLPGVATGQAPSDLKLSPVPPGRGFPLVALASAGSLAMPVGCPAVTQDGDVMTPGIHCCRGDR